jgi:hypothetical protein
MEFDCIDSVLNSADLLLQVGGKYNKDRYELPSPVTLGLTNPLARFSCIKDNHDLVAKSAAETLYAFSGMNGNDFIWEFNGQSDPRLTKNRNPLSIGTLLRFYGKEDLLLDYSMSNNLRQKGNGFTDQILSVAERLKNKSHDEVLSMSSLHHLPIQQAWLYRCENKLNILVSAGYLANTELFFKYIPIFSFMLQIDRKSVV